MFAKKDIKRFLCKFEKKGPEECWPWTANCPDGRYGQFRHPNGRPVQAHRFSYELFVGAIPSGLLVLHSCDNTYCVNPAHLFLGTSQDNTDDMVRKGRSNFYCSQGPGDKACKGEEHGMSKLTESQVVEIRKRYRRVTYHRTNARELSIEFGVTQATITNIVKGRKWKHVREA